MQTMYGHTLAVHFTSCFDAISGLNVYSPSVIIETVFFNPRAWAEYTAGYACFCATTCSVTHLFYFVTALTYQAL